jgi:methanogenic corrinoid protein MtbC1
MDIVGDKMESGDMFIPEVLMAAQAMASCVAVHFGNILVMIMLRMVLGTV